jgi:hypothetical protein
VYSALDPSNVQLMFSFDVNAAKYRNYDFFLKRLFQSFMDINSTNKTASMVSQETVGHVETWLSGRTATVHSFVSTMT